MILTGKAKKDFENGIIEILKQKYSEQIFNNDAALDWIYNVNDLILFAHIIEWFDSVGIYIFINRWVAPLREIEWYFIITNKSGVHLNSHVSKESRIELDSRNEATKQAIKKANEIYNERFK